MAIVLCLYTCCCLFGAGTGSAEYGMASYYGDDFHGRKTASGEVFDQWKLTCAHRDLPFGTRLKVTNLQNKKSVLVRVNDRGPWVSGRLIDLSYAAAKKIDMIKKGVVKVKIEIVK
ncbi:MAG: septal ring lytic transglycosylase RlpA family protein [bacterium]